MNILRNALAELGGTAALLCAVIGSGVMAENLAGGNGAVALLANTLATVFALYVLIETLGPISGAHFNPLVSVVMGWNGALPRRSVLPYIGAQLVGAMVGAVLAHAMFDLSLLQWSTKARVGTGQWLAEAVATGGLIFVILRTTPDRAASLVACYIGGAYWFTASTSFANPAAVLGRAMSDTFAGIAPSSAPGFVVAQCLGAAWGVGCHHLLSGRGGSGPDRKR